MIKKLQIANLSFPVNLIQGPLAGITCAPFRLLTWQYSKPAFCYSEMISANALVKNYKFTRKRYIDKDNKEGPVCFQIVGNTPHELSESAKILTDLGADLIDFNCGCSVPKIYNNGFGSSLLTKTDKLYSLLSTLRYSTHLPLIVKIRVAKDDNKANKEIAKAISDSGVDCAVVHGRNWKERFNVPCDHDLIRFFVEELDIPVIGNGDVSCIDSLKKMLATGCNGVMISRALVGQPWLIGKLIAEAQQKEFNIPSIEETGNIFIKHIEHLSNLTECERTAVLQARKMGKPYAKRISAGKKEFCQKIMECTNLKDFKKLCREYFI